MKKIALLFFITLMITPSSYSAAGFGSDFGEEAAKVLSENLTKNTNKLVEGINVLSTSVDTTIVNKDRFRSASKEFHFSLLGILMSGFGIKLLYDSICEISEKLDKEENENKTWDQILDHHNLIKPTIGILGLMSGFCCIAKSDYLARSCTPV